MKVLDFNPAVFRVKTDDNYGSTNTWDLLTVDGQSPNETIYFMLKGDMPSSGDVDKIHELMNEGDWEEMTLEESENELGDFDIDISIFDTAGEGYAEIIAELKEKLPWIEFTKENIIDALRRFSESYYGDNLSLFTKDELIYKLEEVADEGQDKEYTAIELVKSLREGF